ncbi:MAG: hypothetical protein ABW000_04730 [Actinoplanes sp.]
MKPRFGVLASIAILAAEVGVSARAPWWSARTDIGGPHTSTVSLAGFGGTAFTWCAAVTCLAFAVAAIPVPRRVHRVALGTGLTAWAAAAILWAVLLGRVVRQDADTRRGWAPEIWSRHLTGSTPPLTDTSTGGLSAALIVMFLLLVIGALLAVPRHHARTVLLIAAMVIIVAALTTTTATLWTTSGPRAAEYDWVWLPRPGPAYVALAVLAPVLGAGLLVRPDGHAPRPWRIAWTITAGVCGLATFTVIGGELSAGAPLYLQAATPSGALPTDWGVAANAMFGLATLFPFAVIVQVLFADSRADRHAAGITMGDRPSTPPPAPEPRPVPDDPPAVLHPGLPRHEQDRDVIKEARRRGADRAGSP